MNTVLLFHLSNQKYCDPTKCLQLEMHDTIESIKVSGICQIKQVCVIKHM